jgi:hypothetical protein
MSTGPGNRPVNMRARCSVRPAQPGDAPQVAALLVELGYPDNPAAEIRQRLAMCERETAGLALVAERQGHVVGSSRWPRSRIWSARGAGGESWRSSFPPHAAGRVSAAGLSMPSRKQPASLAASPWRSPARAAAPNPIPSTGTSAMKMGVIAAHDTLKTSSPAHPRPATAPSPRAIPARRHRHDRRQSAAPQAAESNDTARMATSATVSRSLTWVGCSSDTWPGTGLR